MPDRISFNRFTASVDTPQGLPVNIQEYLPTVEELRRAQGSPVAEPALSPMPAKPAAMLALDPSGSDVMRMGSPAYAEDPFEGPLRTLPHSESAEAKIKSSVFMQLGEVIEQSQDPRMIGSWRRTFRLGEELTVRNGWRRHVENRRAQQAA
jgi:hypothetical protein